MCDVVDVWHERHDNIVVLICVSQRRRLLRDFCRHVIPILVTMSSMVLVTGVQEEGRKEEVRGGRRKEEGRKDLRKGGEKNIFSSPALSSLSIVSVCQLQPSLIYTWHVMCCFLPLAILHCTRTHTTALSCHLLLHGFLFSPCMLLHTCIFAYTRFHTAVPPHDIFT